MHTTRRDFLKQLSLGLASVALPGSFTARAVADASTVKIGVPATLTGPLAAYGKNALHGFELAAREINARGGVLGKQIELVIFDISKPQDAKKSMYLFKERYNTIAIIGTDTVFYDKYMSEIAEDIQVPFFILNPFSRTWYKTGLHYTFRLVPNVAMMAANSLNYIVRIASSRNVPISKIGLFVSDSPSWIEAKESLLKMVMERALSVSHIYSIRSNITLDSAKNLVRKSSSLHPDLIFLLTGSSRQLAMIVEQIRRSENKPKGIAGFFTDLGNAAYVAQTGRAFFNLLDINYWGNPRLKITEDFQNRYREIYRAFPSNSSYGAYSATYIVKDAIEMAGSYDKRIFVSRLREREFPSYLLAQSKPVRFDHHGLNINAVPILLQVSNPRPIAIYPEFFAEKTPIFPTEVV